MVKRRPGKKKKMLPMVRPKVPIAPLAPDRFSMVEQARMRGEDVPVGKTVAELKALGWDVDPTWHVDAVLEADPDSPTGYVVRHTYTVRFDSQDALYALAI